ncbi:hypothetical protein CAEBREN_22771 [Caenorhabditis brenneri]|uniref:Uncharacterized protein n=1 Tax=Caenorhabditis brenneri TaxID=135651 RepID=G0ND70_CAEBE|nr:hypothetical protein CAEBREN_22771 [Caenorhabditis brenneri]
MKLEKRRTTSLRMIKPGFSYVSECSEQQGLLSLRNCCHTQSTGGEIRLYFIEKGVHELFYQGRVKEYIHDMGSLEDAPRMHVSQTPISADSELGKKERGRGQGRRKDMKKIKKIRKSKLPGKLRKFPFLKFRG